MAFYAVYSKWPSYMIWKIINLMTGLREIAKVHTGEFRLTANQNLIIANVTAQKKKKIKN